MQRMIGGRRRHPSQNDGVLYNDLEMVAMKVGEVIPISQSESRTNSRRLHLEAQ